MKGIDKWIAFSIVMSVLLISVGVASAGTYVITGGGAVVTVNAPLIDTSSGGSFATAFGDVTIATTDVTTSSDTALVSGTASADSEDSPAISVSVSWANLQDTSAGYAYAVSIGAPDESGDVVLTDAFTDIDASIMSGFNIDAVGSAEVV